VNHDNQIVILFCEAQHYAATQIGVLDRHNPALIEGAEELAERDKLSREAATSELHGYLTDFREMIEHTN